MPHYVKRWGKVIWDKVFCKVKWESYKVVAFCIDYTLPHFTTMLLCGKEKMVFGIKKKKVPAGLYFTIYPTF